MILFLLTSTAIARAPPLLMQALVLSLGVPSPRALHHALGIAPRAPCPMPHTLHLAPCTVPRALHEPLPQNLEITVTLNHCHLLQARIIHNSKKFFMHSHTENVARKISEIRTR